MITAKIQRKFFFTPLRYPGGKTFLLNYFDKVIKVNNLRNVCYVEPYAGGAGAAISLLLLEKVERIVINDYDRAIYAFWWSVFNRTEDLIRLIESKPLNVEEWRRQKEIYTKGSTDLLQLGFATFYLNRTNHSGILMGGPIGGMQQKGKWALDARYRKDKLTEKIRLIAIYSDRVTVLNKDGLEVIRKYSKDPKVLFYIDPPYYTKGKSLYLNAYTPNDHQKLANLLDHLPDAKWVLSYDNVPQIRGMYIDREQQFEFSLYYHAHSSKKGSELMVFSDNLAVPNE